MEAGSKELPAGNESGVKVAMEEALQDSASFAEDPEAMVPDERRADERQALIGEKGRGVMEKLKDIGKSLLQLCHDTDPLFIQIGRELQQVSSETRILTGSVMETAHLVSNKESESGILDRTSGLVRQILDSLAGGRDSVESSMQGVRELVNQIQKFQSINEQIETISSRFRIIRINIRIQCSSSLIGEEMFNSVTEDIDSLSRKLNSITAQVKKDLFLAVRKLTRLDQEVTRNLQQFARVSAEAREIVSQAVRDINQLMNGAVIMIEEAGTRSKVIAEKVDDVVVSIQFHDSLSQRAGHIQHALDDICELLGGSGEDITPEHMGSAWHILDLQHRQLQQIADEVGAVKHRIRSSFQIMEREVSGLNAIDCNSRFEAIGPQQFLSTLFASLQEALMKLCALLTSSKGMLEQMRESARETKGVVDNLQELMKDIQGMREDTRLQAANTIIMASNLGQQGRTIQVLAKEISTLSRQTGDVTEDAEMMQSGIVSKVASLLDVSNEDSGSINVEEVDTITRSIGSACQEVERRITEVSTGIKDAGRHIEEVGSVLAFLEDLQERIVSITGHVEEVKDLLDEWKDLGSSNSEEVRQLVERYTMDRERKVHSFGRVDALHEEQSDEEIFF